MSNYYKYYHLRASPISKYDQNGQNPQILPSQSPLQFSGSKTQNDTSPWRNMPSQPVVLQNQISTSQYMIGDKTLQHLSLEKQNECLRKEKSELENQIQKLKLYYTKQTTMDQQELMRYEREKASLADKLREMDEMLTNLQEKYEKELATEKNNNRKQRQEWESKIERITSYYNEQLALKQEEIHKTKNKLQLSEINVTDLSAKLKIFEQTNKDLRSKWDDDIKNFGQELEVLNKQLLSQRFRNDELERLAKINKAVNGNSTPPSNQQEDNIYLKEIENIKNQSLELKNRNFELEKKIQMYENKKMTESEIQNSIYKDKLEQKIQEHEKAKNEFNKKASELQILAKDLQIVQGRLTQSEKENQEKDTLVIQMMAHIDQIEKENREYQSGQNFNGIEEKLQQLHHQNQMQKQELDFFANELERITNRNRLLEEQLYQPETQINSHKQYQQLEKQLDKIDMKCNQIKLEITKKDESFQSQRGNYASVEEEIQASFGDIHKKFNELSHQVKQAKSEIEKEQNGEESNKNNTQTINTVQQGQDPRARQITADFSPISQQRHKHSFNPSQNEELVNKSPVTVPQKVQEPASQNPQLTDTGLKSEFKKVTIPKGLIQVNDFEKEHHQDSIQNQLIAQKLTKQENIEQQPEKQVQSEQTKQAEQTEQAIPVNNNNNNTTQNDQYPDNASQQTFGGHHKSSIDQVEQLAHLEELIGHPDKVKEYIQQEEAEMASLLAGNERSNEGSPSTASKDLHNPKPLHQQLKELSEQYSSKDYKPIHPMNLTPKVQQQHAEQKKPVVEQITFMDSFRAHENEKDHLIKINDIKQTESYIAEKTTPVNIRRQEQQQVVTPPPLSQQNKYAVITPPPRQPEVPINYADYNIISLKAPKIDAKLIELDILSILNYANQGSSDFRHQFDKNMEGSEVFDIVVGFVGASKSGKSTVINSICKEDWDIATKTESCNKKMQLFRYTCMNKKVGLCESDLINDHNFMHFICNFAQAIVLSFNSWEITDERAFVDYIKLLQSENNFASECIVIHSNSESLSQSSIDKITKDLTKLQDGLYRGKVDGKQKKINVYHLMLHNYNDKTKKKSIFEETIAVCRGTIIGKLTTNKEKVDVFKRLNRFLIN